MHVLRSTLVVSLLLSLSAIGTSKESEKTLDIATLTTQAENGDADAQIEIALRYRDGKGVDKDVKAALNWFRKCADSGDARGSDHVGFMYFNGLGVPRDFNIATAYYKAAAKENNAQGQYHLGDSVFSGLGVEQSYDGAATLWKSAAKQGHADAKWRLACLYAVGEHLKRDGQKAEQLCREVAEKGHINGTVLLGELLAARGEKEEAFKWWKKAADNGSKHGKTLLELADWRWEKPSKGHHTFIEADHFYQGWNNCGSTSVAMFARHFGVETTPYDVKRLCLENPIGEGTDWEDLVSTCKNYHQKWKLVTFGMDDDAYQQGLEFIRKELDAGRPVVMDFTMVSNRDGKETKAGHTLTVAGYNKERDQYVLRNPNQPPPGLQLITTTELKSKWYSDGYSRLSKGATSRPLIVVDTE